MSPARDPRPLLLTIPTSHFCEKARWGLARGGIDFREEGHLPLFNRAAGVLAARRWASAPVLLTAEGPLTDSTDILGWADRHAAPGRRLYPEDPTARAEALAIEELCDVRLGPHTRRLGYHWVFGDPALTLRLVAEAAAPRLEVLAVRLFRPAVAAMMKRGMRIDEAGVARSRARVDEVFGEIERRLADGRRYLAGPSFSAADLTFAALAAPVVLPAEYGARLPRLDELDASVRAEVEALRARPAGRFVLRVYSEERVGTVVRS